MLPSWIVGSKTIYHTSTRPSKRVRPDWIKEHYRTMSHQPRTRVITGPQQRLPGIIITSTKLVPARTGPLHLNEYRFWRAFEGRGRCRQCLKLFDTQKERIAHQKAEGCTRILVDAYDLLLRDMKCVVCDNKTDKSKWGVPLCNNVCLYRWQFETGAGAYAVQMAVKLLEYQKPNKLTL